MSIPRRSYTLAVTRPGNLTSLPAAKIAVFQACELDLTLRLPTGETFDGATQVRLEIHTSQTSDPDDVLTTFVVNSPTGNTLTLGLTGDYLNHTFTGPLGEFWLNIVAHWADTDRIEPLRCANLFLHRHNASLTTPPPPAGLIPYVRFDIAQTGLTTQQKTQARTNIAAASESQANSIQTELTNLASSTTSALGSKADLGEDGKVPSSQLPASSGGTWGSITGTLSAQTDLQSSLDAKASSSHVHSGADITSGNIAVARIATALTTPGPIGETTPNSISATTLKVGTDSGKGIISYATNRIDFNNNGGQGFSIQTGKIEIGSFTGGPVSIEGPAAGEGNTNRVGTDLIIKPGSATGNATPGSVSFCIGVIGSSGGSTQSYTERAKVDSLGVTVSGRLTVSEIITHGNYTVGTVPSPSGSGGAIYVSNESGGGVLAFSDGTNWRRLTDRAIIS